MESKSIKIDICQMKDCKTVKFLENDVNRNPSYFRFFTFPKENIMKHEWIKVCNRQELIKMPDETLKNKFVCSCHFTISDLINSNNPEISELKQTIVPKTNMENIKSITTFLKEKNKVEQIRNPTLNEVIGLNSQKIMISHDLENILKIHGNLKISRVVVSGSTNSNQNITVSSSNSLIRNSESSTFITKESVENLKSLNQFSGASNEVAVNNTDKVKSLMDRLVKINKIVTEDIKIKGKLNKQVTNLKKKVSKLTKQLQLCEKALKRERGNGFNLNDLTPMQLCFFQDQIKSINTGSHGMRWSADTVQLAMDIYSVSKDAYRMLCADFRLPSEHTVKRFILDGAKESIAKKNVGKTFDLIDNEISESVDDIEVVSAVANIDESEMNENDIIMGDLNNACVETLINNNGLQVVDIQHTEHGHMTIEVLDDPIDVGNIYVKEL